MAKRCRFIGFHLYTDSNFPRPPLIAGLALFDSCVTKYRKRDQHFTIQVIGDYLCGRILTFQAGHPRILAKKASLETVLDRVPEGMAEVSFNYFILHTKTLHGLYAYYGGSVSFTDFGTRLTGMSRRAVREARRDEFRAAKKKAKKTGGELTKEESNAIDAKYSIVFHALLRRETMDRVIAKWKEVRAVRYQVSTTAVDADRLGALRPHTKARVEELRLEPSVSARNYAEKIQAWVTWLKNRFGDALKRTTVIGTNNLGQHKTMDLGKLVDYFADIDLDDLHAEAARPPTQLNRSGIIAQLIDEANDRPDYFDKVK